MQDTQVPPDSALVDVEALLQASDPASAFLQSTVSPFVLVINMAIGILLALTLQWLYKRHSSTWSNHSNFAKVFPILVVTTILIITIVKSSLALSLGLVGALSIVRFRTPIKEPEELAFIFICIAIGLGLGASQTLATLVGSAVVFGTIAFAGARQAQEPGKNMYLSVAWGGNGQGPGDKLMALNALMGEHTHSCDLRRVDARDDGLEASYMVEFESQDRLANMMESLKRGEDSLELTFIDQGRLDSR